MRVLSVDIGTTAMKMGVFQTADDTLNLIGQFSQEYTIHTYNDGLCSDIEPAKWQQAFMARCKQMADLMPAVDVISLTKWMRNCTYRFETESSMKGAAMLGLKYLKK